MTTYTVRKGRRYRAITSLGLLHSVASNDILADNFEVTGSGRTRFGQALLPHEDASADIPTRSRRSRRLRYSALLTAAIAREA